MQKHCKMDVKEVKMQKGCKDVKRCKMMFKTSLQPFYISFYNHLLTYFSLIIEHGCKK